MESSRRFSGRVAIVGLATLLIGCALGFLLAGRTDLLVLGSSATASQPADDRFGPLSPRALSLADLLAMDDAALDRLDPLEVDLAVARTIPGCVAGRGLLQADRRSMGYANGKTGHQCAGLSR